MKHPDEVCHELYHDWYEYTLTECVEQLAQMGFMIKYTTVRGNKKDTEPAIFFDEHNVAFDADVDWDIFFLNDKTFAEEYPHFFMLASANPKYYTAQVRRTGHRCLGIECGVVEYDINTEYHENDIVEAGFFKGVTIGEVAAQIDCEKVSEYILDVAKTLARAFKNQLDAEYDYQYNEIYEQYVQDYREWQEAEHERTRDTDLDGSTDCRLGESH